MTKPVKFNIECRVGRLVEIRLEWLNEASDIGPLEAALNRAFTHAGSAAVICADCRGIDVLSPEVGDALLEVFRRTNRHIERSAILLSASNAIFNLQIERLLRGAANPGRRAFRNPELMLAWLSEVLKSDEFLRAKQFLAA